MLLPPRQLALALDHAESYAREDFLSGSGNEDALKLIECWPDWPANAIALIGPEGSGKTHLASIWSAAAGARVVPPARSPRQRFALRWPPAHWSLRTPRQPWTSAPCFT